MLEFFPEAATSSETENVFSSHLHKTLQIALSLQAK